MSRARCWGRLGHGLPACVAAAWLFERFVDAPLQVWIKGGRGKSEAEGRAGAGLAANCHPERSAAGPGATRERRAFGGPGSARCALVIGRRIGSRPRVARGPALDDLLPARKRADQPVACRQSDEIWHFYAGAPLELLVYDPASRTFRAQVLAAPAASSDHEPIGVVRAGEVAGGTKSCR